MGVDIMVWLVPHLSTRASKIRKEIHASVANATVTSILFGILFLVLHCWSILSNRVYDAANQRKIVFFLLHFPSYHRYVYCIYIRNRHSTKRIKKVHRGNI